ncbi:hypothetical protein AL036_14990 [Salipiger aestuarii]|uniref:Uncharacterized protein DUF4167 n=1 Tax=Salipiger aestuarii TaxID=568098 RepID=A0A327XWW6_9RHOB|nr:DUF4167 domain-containing protein [Salipiger aestuarii]KAA8606306.1 hypothetical protein AL036_14990 [Salipiger aestuarii]KAB2540967.1 hypothetical protein AL035_14915 [Salipiger aestuarii]RAK13143.1 uncharacterized protein DUF4167 [Salipiger aestuarii]
MRSSKSRSRSKNNRNRSSLGNVVNRVFDSSGPEGKVRGTPQQIIDKYNQLARDAGLSNDRVAAENFQQHAEHYMRMLSEAQRDADQRREHQERENRERQAQRDKDRSDQRDNQRSDRDDRGDSDQPQNNSGQNNQGQGNQGQGDQGHGDQPQTAQPQTAQPRPDQARQQPAEPVAEGAPQPDVIDMGDNSDSGLVETPENRETPAPAPAEEKPKKPRRPRKKPEPRKPKAESDSGATESAPADPKGDTPASDAAE